MRIIIKLLRNRNFILVLAVVLGLSIGHLATWTEPTVLPLLALVMTLSVVSITSRELASFKTMTRPILISLLLNYVVLGGVILFIAWWLIDDRELWTGFVVLAAVPPAVAVTPFSYILKGNTFFSLIGMVAAYLAALVLTPLIMVIFIGVSFLDPVKLTLMLVQLILVPLIVSRLLRLTRWVHHIETWRGSILNWSFFLVVFTIIGLNQQVLFGQLDVVLRIAIVAIVFTFVLGHIIRFIARILRVSRETTVSLMLMGTQKNFALASAIALNLFSERASIPSAISIVFAILYIVWLGFYLKKRG